jgi:hypothetical protein
MSAQWTDPAELSLDELRAERGRLQAEEDVVSYVRRLAQGRVDMLRAELRRRSEREAGTPSGDISGELPNILGTHVAAGSARPPRDTEVSADHPLVAELDALCAAGGFDDMKAASDQEIGALVSQVAEWEKSRSADRHALFERIDALTAELVGRYRDGQASVDTLLADG